MSLAKELLSKYNSVFTVSINLDGKGKKQYPVWQIMEGLLYIVAKQKDGEEGKKRRFILNRAQCLLYEEMCRMQLEGKPVRIDILKARQIGFSTFIAGFLFVMTAFTPQYKSAVIADEKGHAKNIFRKYEFFWQNLDCSNPHYQEIRQFEMRNPGKVHPMSWKPARKYSKGQEYMEFEKDGQILEVLVAGEGAGRSDTYDAMHYSECAFFQGNLSATLNGATETVPNALNTFVFLETTANGFNEYKDIWDSDVEGGGESYSAFFMPWYKNPEYSTDLLVGEQMPMVEPWLKERQIEHNLTDSQILWYWRKYLSKRRNLEDTLQEYPFTPVDAFISTGECVFGSDLVAKMKEYAASRRQSVERGYFSYQRKWSPDGNSCSITNVRFERCQGPWRVYEEPIEGHPYVAICDPNNETNDDSAIQVLDNTTARIVASYSSSEDNWDSVAYQLYCVGRWYNDALISNEMNIGKSVMEYIVKFGYPNIYIRQASLSEDYRQRIKSQYGHLTTIASRPNMLSDLKIAFREDPYMVPDYETLCEMESFQRVRHTSRNGSVRTKEEAAAGKHDDLVMALAAFFTVRHQQSFFVNDKEKPKQTHISLEYENYMRKIREREPNDLEAVTGIDFEGGYYD